MGVNWVTNILAHTLISLSLTTAQHIATLLVVTVDIDGRDCCVGVVIGECYLESEFVLV
jgi:hypothetical protein